MRPVKHWLVLSYNSCVVTSLKFVYLKYVSNIFIFYFSEDVKLIMEKVSKFQLESNTIIPTLNEYNEYIYIYITQHYKQTNGGCKYISYTVYLTTGKLK